MRAINKEVKKTMNKLVALLNSQEDNPKNSSSIKLNNFRIGETGDIKDGDKKGIIYYLEQPSHDINMFFAKIEEEYYPLYLKNKSNEIYCVLVNEKDEIKKTYSKKQNQAAIFTGKWLKDINFKIDKKGKIVK